MGRIITEARGPEKILDITDSKIKVKLDLFNEIQRRVKDTQKYVIQPYPDGLKMTKDQFKILSDDVSMLATQVPGENLFLTKYNAMEVIVV